MKFITALVTPFDSDNKIDEEALHNLCESNIADGCDGFFVGGSIGECFLLSDQERIRLFEIISQYKDRLEIHAHVGAISTEQAKLMAKEAKALGINHIASTPPFYYGFSGKEIAGYYYELSSYIEMPVLYYDIPMATKYSLDFNNKDIQELFRSGCINAVKHTNSNTENIYDMRKYNKDIKIFGGLESNVLKLLDMGCEGFIGSTFNFMLPEFKKAVCYYYAESYLVANNMVNSKGLQYTQNLVDEVVEVVDTLLKVSLQGSMKYLLERKGIRVGETRTPFRALDATDIEILENMMKKPIFTSQL